MTRKVALGLFHFNVQYVAGNLRLYHRYCTEAVLPFLEQIAEHPTLRVSFEMSGSGLEFLARHYASYIALLHDLIEKRQIELISSTYAPTLWIAFPGRDLLKSIDHNQRVLSQLGLQNADIFFAQESFFGSGLKKIANKFSIALCKDEYVAFYHGNTNVNPAYKIGPLTVLVGSNHLMNDIAEQLSGDMANKRASGLWGFTRRRLEERKDALSGVCTNARKGTRDGLSWYWYHMGSGHHFASPTAPDEDVFECNTDWMRYNLRNLSMIAEKGYAFTHIGEFASFQQATRLADFPVVIEGSWNTERSAGGFTWMGNQSMPWQNSNGNLGLAWRSRLALRTCEVALEKLPGIDATGVAEKLEPLWRQQIIAESSDPLGWRPLPEEVMYGSYAAEQALQAAQQLKAQLRLFSSGSLIQFESALEPIADLSVPPIDIEVVGEEPFVSWQLSNSGGYLLQVVARSSAGAIVVRFPRKSNVIWYCPTGLETEPLRINIDTLVPSRLCFPLSNGLIGVEDDIAIIRVNRSGQVAAVIDKAAPSIAFMVLGAGARQCVQWKFLILRCTALEAVVVANTVNAV